MGQLKINYPILEQIFLLLSLSGE